MSAEEAEGLIPVFDDTCVPPVRKDEQWQGTHARRTRPKIQEKLPEVNHGSKFNRVRELATRQKKKERHERMDTQEVLSSDDEDGEKVGLGLKLVQHMQKNSNQDELIAQFQAALLSSLTEEELGARFDTPEVGSSIISWKIEDDLEKEMSRVEGKRGQKQVDRRAAAIKRIQGDDKQLDLSHLGLGDSGAEEFAAHLGENDTMEELIVSINGLGVQGATSIAQSLRSHPTLCSLSISHNNIGNAGFEAVVSVLQTCPTLTELRADFNNIGPAVPPELAQITGLKRLALRGNQLETFPLPLLKSLDQVDLDDNAPQLRQYVEASLQLAEDASHRSACRREAAAQLAHGWAMWKDLDMPKAQTAMENARRKLSESGVEDQGDMALAVAELEEAIRARRAALGPGFVRVKDPEQVMVGESIEGAVHKIENGAQRVSLFGQVVGDVGVTSLATALRDNASLVWLDLESCSVGPRGARELAAALQGNSTLETLMLSRNQIGDGGARALAAAMDGNTTLSTLDVSRNALGPGGAAAIARSVMANPSMRQLSFRLNNISDDGATAVAAALKSLRGLQELDLAGCGVGAAGSAAIKHELQFHPGLLHGKLWR